MKIFITIYPETTIKPYNFKITLVTIKTLLSYTFHKLKKHINIRCNSLLYTEENILTKYANLSFMHYLLLMLLETLSGSYLSSNCKACIVEDTLAKQSSIKF